MKKRVLVVAPHPDDETLGVGGTIAKYAEEGGEVAVLVISGHLPPLYDRAAYETTVKEAQRAFEILGVSQSRFLEIPTGTLAGQPPGAVNGRITQMIEQFRPEVVLCPFPDRHIDHRLVFDSVMVAARPRGTGRAIGLLAAYETLSETHWNAPQIEPNFVPNMVVDITGQMERKMSAVKCYESQLSPFPAARSVEAVDALAKFRGTQAGFAFGEGFHIIRMLS